MDLSSWFVSVAWWLGVNPGAVTIDLWTYSHKSFFADQYHSPSVSSITSKVNDSFMKSATEHEDITSNELASWNDSLFEMFEK